MNINKKGFEDDAFHNTLLSFLFRSVLQPWITSVTLLTLTALTGLLNVTFLLRSNFLIGLHTYQKVELMDMGYIVAGANVLTPLLVCLLVHKVGHKKFMLLSAGLMAASLLFLTLLSHFQGEKLLEFISSSPGFGWTVQTAIVAFLIGHQMGAGPLSWLFCVELLPAKAVEIGLGLAAAVWWAFNLVFSLTLASLVKAIGMSGICAIHAVVSILLYGFVLQILPDIRGNSLQEIEEFYRMITNTQLDKKFRFSFRSTASTNTNF